MGDQSHKSAPGEQAPSDDSVATTRDVARATRERMAAEGIPVGTDDPMLLALGATPLPDSGSHEHCREGTVLHLKIVGDLAHEGVDTWKDKPVDRCIAPLVRALQDGGIDMLGSCCGHGHSPGQIVLADGRRLVIRLPERTIDGAVGG